VVRLIACRAEDERSLRHHDYRQQRKARVMAQGAQRELQILAKRF